MSYFKVLDRHWVISVTQNLEMTPVRSYDLTASKGKRLAFTQHDLKETDDASYPTH